VFPCARFIQIIDDIFHVKKYNHHIQNKEQVKTAENQKKLPPQFLSWNIEGSAPPKEFLLYNFVGPDTSCVLCTQTKLPSLVALATHHNF
jgi:hypothetical protein